MSCPPRRALLPLLAVLLLAGPGARGAGKPSCRECAWRQCVEDSIKQKQALIKVYEGLAKKWAGEVKEPPAILDLEKLPKAERAGALAKLTAEFEAFTLDENQATRGVGAPAGCDLSPAAAIEMETDSVTCVIDMAKAGRAEQQLPCQELWEIAMQHEAIHLNRCNQRKGGREAPAKLLTPYGKAHEEIDAYRYEIAKLEELLSDGVVKVDAKVTVISGVRSVTVLTKGDIPFRILEKGRVQGTAEQTIAVDASELGCQGTVVPDQVQYPVAGEKKKVKGKETLTLWSASPQAPLLRLDLDCPAGPGNLPIPYWALRRHTFDYKDKAKVALDVGKITGGTSRGTVLYTLRLCRQQKRR